MSDVEIPLEKFDLELYNGGFSDLTAIASVKYAKKDQRNKSRYPGLYEKTFEMYEPAVQVRGIKLRTQEYLIFQHSTLDYKNRNVAPPGKVIMTYHHIRHFVEEMERIDHAIDDSFELVSDNLYKLSSEGLSVRYRIDKLYENSFLVFEPVIFAVEEGNEDEFVYGERAVRMYINSHDGYLCETSLDYFKAFVMFFRNPMALLQDARNTGVVFSEGNIYNEARRSVAKQPIRSIKKGKEDEYGTGS